MTDHVFDHTQAELFSVSDLFPTTKLGVVHQSAKTGGTDNWITPLAVVKFAESLIGHPLELDVCATRASARCPMYLTPEMDALSLDWWGNVWMNPPYSKTGHWLQYLEEQVNYGNVERAVALVAARTDTKWWWRAVEQVDAICFLKGRIKFLEEKPAINASGYEATVTSAAPYSAPFPSALLFYGSTDDLVGHWKTGGEEILVYWADIQDWDGQTGEIVLLAPS